MDKKTNENKLRKKAIKKGCRIVKSRQCISADNMGDYMLIDDKTNGVIMGNRFDATLEQIDKYLK